MKPRITTLANGLRVISVDMPHLETSAIGVYVGVGARHETKAQHGISHFLEHMAFKGTGTRSAREIAEEIESVGGELNAATSLETTAYYARVLKGDEGVALELLADILHNSAFAVEEIVREKEVVLQEIASLVDSPDEIAYDLLQDAAFPGQPAGRPIIGTKESVARFTPRDLRGFLKTHYRPSNMVLSAAGAITHNSLVRHAEALFGGLDRTVKLREQPARYEGGIRTYAKPFEQSHLVLGFEGPSYVSDDYYTAQVFSGLFGGGMSSRLFQEARERRGLCYSIYSSAWGIKDSGMIGVHAATGPSMMRELTEVVAVELRRLAEDGATIQEIYRAKAQLKAGLLMSLESVSARADQMARQLLALGRVMSPAELIAKVEAVDRDGIRAFAGRLLAGRPSIAVVGAGRRSAGLAAHAEARLRA